MCDWEALDAELDRWAAAGRAATLWWRDDDAEAPCPALDRLLELAAGEDVPLGVAVIPAGAGAALAARLRTCPRASAMQHGWQHRNHAPAGEKRAELGAHRPAPVLLGELGGGRCRLERLLGAGAGDILVPPWNRIQEDLLARLPALGFRGLSRFEPRGARRAAPGLSQTNTHVDIIDWRGGRGFRGVAPVLGSLVSHLAARRTGTVDADEPTGILTHHRVNDEPCWSFLRALLRHARTHRAARWLTPREAVLGP